MADFSVILQSQQFRDIVQTNALDRVFRDALFPKLLFRNEVVDERWDANVGDNKVFTGNGLMKVRMTPLRPGVDPVPHDYNQEQWEAQQQKFADTIDTHMPTAITAAVNKLLVDMKQLGLNAGQTINRLIRNKLFNAAQAGWTVVDTTSGSQTTFRVKRLNGFTRARRPDLTTGSPVRYALVTANNPLPITVVHTGSPTTVNITNFTPDTPGDEIGPGTVTVDAAVTVADRDPVYASTRSYLVRSGGGNSVDALTAGTDILHLAEIRSAVARLRDVDVQEFDDGSFHAHIDPISEGQLFSDNEVQRLNIGIPDGEMYREFAIGRLLGCTFYRNNENPKIANVDGASTASWSAADPFGAEMWTLGSASTGSKVHRTLFLGREFCNEYWADQSGMITEAGVGGRTENSARITNDGVDIVVDRIMVIMRQPSDRLAEMVATTWKFQGDWACRTDGATGDAAAIKRAITVESTE